MSNTPEQPIYQNYNNHSLIINYALYRCGRHPNEVRYLKYNPRSQRPTLIALLSEGPLRYENCSRFEQRPFAFNVEWHKKNQTVDGDLVYLLKRSV